MVFDLNVTGDGKENLAATISLAWKLAGYDKPVRSGKKRGFKDYRVIPADPAEPDENRFPTLVFQNSATSDSCSMPYTLDATDIANFANNWLDEVEYPDCPDIDGTTAKGWRVRHQSEGHPYHDWLIIEPAWIIYGK